MSPAERDYDNANPVEVTWWWTPDCGYLHIETDPITLDLVHCRDGVAPPSPQDDES